jgi:hypothetical protein
MGEAFKPVSLTYPTGGSTTGTTQAATVGGGAPGRSQLDPPRPGFWVQFSEQLSTTVLEEGHWTAKTNIWSYTKSKFPSDDHSTTMYQVGLGVSLTQVVEDRIWAFL